jgi:hypothetical protein
MKTMILMTFFTLTSLAQATDVIAIGYNTKDDLKGSSVKIQAVKLEFLSEQTKIGNSTRTREEQNVVAEPDFQIFKYSLFKVEASPALGLSNVSDRTLTFAPTVENPKHFDFKESNNINLLTGASLGLKVDVHEGFNLGGKIGAINTGSGFKEQVSFSASIDF